MNVPSGYSALDFIGFTDKGDYSPSATYVKNDLVHYNDKIWKCLIDDTTGIAPTTGVNWEKWIDQSNSLDGLADVEITNPTDGQELSYDAATEKWKNTSKIQTLTNQVKGNWSEGGKNVLDLTPRLKKNFPTSSAIASFSNEGIVLDGTVSSSGNFRICPAEDDNSFVLPQGTYVLSHKDGSSPSGASITLRKNGTAITTNNRLATPYEFEANGTDYFTVLIHEDATTFNNAVVCPMICLKSFYELDTSFEPYAKTNQQLTQDTTALLDNLEVNGAVNMLPNNGTSQTLGDGHVTFIVNDDKTVTVTADGQQTSSVEFPLYTNSDGSPHLIGKTIKLSGCPSGGSSSTYSIQAYRIGTTDGSTGTASDLGDGVTFTWLNNGSGTKAVVKIIIRPNYSGTITFKPMITVPSYNGDYVPYAKSNKELTEDVVNEYISSEFDSSNIITNHNLYAQRDGKNLYLYGWVELPAGTYNYGDDLFTIKHKAGVLNSILIGADLTNHSQSPIFMRILNRTNIVEMESPVTLSATTKIQFVATPIYLG